MEAAAASDSEEDSLDTVMAEHEEAAEASLTTLVGSRRLIREGFQQPFILPSPAVG